MILQMFEPGHGGVLTYVTQITRHLIDSHRATAVAFSSNRGDEGLPKLMRLLQEHDTPSIDMQIANGPCGGDIVAFWRLWKFCRRTRPQLIHCHSSKAGMLGRVLAYSLGIPVVYSPHAYFGLGANAKSASTVSNCVERNLGRFGHTMACSNGEREFAIQTLRLSPDRITLNENGVDFGRFVPPQDDVSRELRKRQNLPQDQFVVLGIGRLEYQKDPLTLLRGFALAQEVAPELHLHFVGQGKLEEETEQEIARLGIGSHLTRTKYHGSPNELYQAADCYVSSSRYEGLPLVVLEALASNLPMVLTQCPGHQRFFEIAFNQLSPAKVESPEEIAAGILQLYRQRHSPTNHREIASELFSQESTLTKTVALYDQLIAGNGN